jgi:hypothetical protein
MSDHINSVRESVQHNCHIADAQYAGDYTLCVYLLKMRELYRWEMEQDYEAPLPHDEVGQWLKSREALWESLEGNDYGIIETGDTQLNPFDTDRVNEQLNPKGLIYSGGLGCKCRPHFFLGELERQEKNADFHLLVSNKEYARDLTSPPAMSLGNTIFVRRESLKRMLWEKKEEAHWNKGETPMERLMALYPFQSDLSKALDQMTDDLMEQLIRHEIGEVKAGQLLGPQWEEMLSDLPRSRIEIMLRAVRDHLADCVETLPHILNDNPEPQQIHFYMANLNGMRKQLFPALLEGYEIWRETGNLNRLRESATRGADHWKALSDTALSQYLQDGNASFSATQDLIEQQAL